MAWKEIVAAAVVVVQSANLAELEFLLFVFDLFLLVGVIHLG